MTLNDLYQTDPARLGLAASPGANWGTPAYQNQQSWLNAPAQDDQVAMMRNLQADSMVRKLKARGDADSANRKLMFLQQFANKPVNLYGAPQDQAQAQLQGLVQQDYNARQQGVNNMLSFQNQSSALNQARQKYAEGQGQLIDAGLNRQLLRQKVKDEFDPNSEESQTKQLRVEALKQSNSNSALAGQQTAAQLANAPFDQALRLVSNGVQISDALKKGLTPDQVVLLNGYQDAQNRIAAQKQAEYQQKINPQPTPNEVRLSDAALQKYGGMQNRAGILTAKAQKYSQDIAKEQAADHGWFYTAMNPFEGSGRGSSFIGTPAYGTQQGNPGDVTAQFAPFVSPTKPQDYVNAQLANDKISSSLIHQGPNGLESLLAQRPQVAQADSSMPMGVHTPSFPSMDGVTSGLVAPLTRNATGDYIVRNQQEQEMVPVGQHYVGPTGIRRVRTSGPAPSFLDAFRQQLPAPYRPESQQTYFDEQSMPDVYTGPQQTFFGHPQ